MLAQTGRVTDAIAGSALFFGGRVHAASGAGEEGGAKPESHPVRGRAMPKRGEVQVFGLLE